MVDGPRKSPCSAADFREPHTHFLRSRLLFLRGRNGPIHGADRAWARGRIPLLNQLVGLGSGGEVGSRSAGMRALAPRLAQWDADTSLRATSSSTMTLVQFNVNALASRFAAALFASQAIGANATSASPAKTPRASDPAGNEVAARR